jgi:signal transduction histidine kinase
VEAQVQALGKKMTNERSEGNNDVRDLVRVQAEYDTVILDITHALRSSLHTIAVRVERLDHELTVTASRRSVHSLIEGLQRIIMSTSYLLDTVRFQNPHLAVGSLLKENVNWKDIVEPVVAVLKDAAASSRVNVVIQGMRSTRTICGDEQALRTALYNLLENAIKYSKTPSTVQVVYTENRDVAVIVVENEGVGMETSEAQHLFEAGYRGQNRRAIPGTGIGLFATSKIIEAHGGNITASTSTTGTFRVEIHLPLGESEDDPRTISR